MELGKSDREISLAMGWGGGVPAVCMKVGSHTAMIVAPGGSLCASCGFSMQVCGNIAVMRNTLQFKQGVVYVQRMA